MLPCDRLTLNGCDLRRIRKSELKISVNLCKNHDVSRLRIRIRSTNTDLYLEASAGLRRDIYEPFFGVVDSRLRDK